MGKRFGGNFFSILNLFQINLDNQPILKPSEGVNEIVSGSAAGKVVVDKLPPSTTSTLFVSVLSIANKSSAAKEAGAVTFELLLFSSAIIIIIDGGSSPIRNIGRSLLLVPLSCCSS